MKFTAKKKAKFLEYLMSGVTVSGAAAMVKMNRQYLYRLKERNKKFSEAWDEAYEIGTEALEDEAKRRAVKGVIEPKFHNGKMIVDEKGNPVGVRKYSDTLLIFLLKGRNPKKFKDFVEVSGPGGKAPVFEVVLTNANKAES